LTSDLVARRPTAAKLSGRRALHIQNPYSKKTLGLRWLRVIVVRSHKTF